MRDSSLSPSSRPGGAVISDRIVSALLEELRTGRYAQTDRLPAEVDLCRRTRRQPHRHPRCAERDGACGLHRAGARHRHSGQPKCPEPAQPVGPEAGVLPAHPQLWQLPHADGIRIYPVRAGEELARDLAIEPGDDVICIKKRILADTTPVIYSIDYLPRALFGNRDYTRIDLSGDIFDVLGGSAASR